MIFSCVISEQEDYCDGLGDCLPACPTGAITFEEREAPAYNEAAVKQALQASGRFIPWSVVTISTEGQIIE